MLPPGTLRYLKGHHDGIVIVVLVVMTFGAMAGGLDPLAAIAVLALAVFAYHIRCVSKQAHDHKMEQLKVDGAVAKAEMIKARHRDLLENIQPTLPLERRPRISVNRRPDDGKAKP